MNTSVMKRGGRTTLASVLAGAGALLLRSRFTVKAAQEARQEVVTTPDVEAFRKTVQAAYQNSDYAKVWPKGLVDRINAVK